VLSIHLLIHRPSVPVNLQNTALSRLVLALEGVSPYHTTRDTANRKRKRKLRAQAGAIKRVKASTDDIQSPSIGQSHAVDIEHDPDTTQPEVLPHLTIGINQVTKRLETQAQAYRELVSLGDQNDAEDHPNPSLIRIVFVCRADIDPPLLIAHIPTLVASCNSSRRAITNPAAYPPIKLVPLPARAEFALAEATGLRRLSIIALDVRHFSGILRKPTNILVG
jgi:ribonuclease P/MRP protein subunit POP3